MSKKFVSPAIFAARIKRKERDLARRQPEKSPLSEAEQLALAAKAKLKKPIKQRSK